MAERAFEESLANKITPLAPAEQRFEHHSLSLMTYAYELGSIESRLRLARVRLADAAASESDTRSLDGFERVW
ncbi:hypothetical protein, partial [Staphylococcus aureus]